jgi:glycosyltransferase involved in cell wall biosynthesis
MKILHVINSFEIGGGAEKIVLDIVLELKSRGVSIEVLSIINPSLHGSNLFCDILISNNIPINFLATSNVYDPRNINKCMKFLKYHKYDVIHTHLFPAQYIIPVALFFSSYKTRLITTEHSTHNWRRSYFLLKFLERKIYKSYSRIICVSNGIRDSLATHLGEHENLVVIHNGINLTSFYEAEPVSLKILFKSSVTPFLILQTAYFREAKDQITVIRALSLLPKGIHVAFAGGGNPERIALCKKEVETYSLQKQVHFLGLRSDIPQLVKAADIVVVSSHWEGFGLSAVEGMACGKPVIASNVLGLSGVVKGAGLLFEKGDHKELAKIILELYKDKTLYNKISQRCSVRASKFDVKEMVDRYNEVYLEV